MIDSLRWRIIWRWTMFQIARDCRRGEHVWTFWYDSRGSCKFCPAIMEAW